MKNQIIAIISAGSLLALASCTGPVGPNTKRDATTGALIGAAGGAIIGHQSGETAEGALLGAGLGAAAGAAVGNQKDQRQGY